MTKRARVSNRARRRLASLTLIALAVAGAPVASHAGSAVGAFEIDGNTADDSGPGDPIDWQSAPPPSHLVEFVDGTGSTDDSFQSSKENEPGQWKFVNQSVPQKDDLLGGAVAWREIGGHIYTSVNFTRKADQGDAFTAFEFNRTGATFTNAQGSQVPARSPGDMLIAMFVTNGGVTLDIDLRRWVGTRDSGFWHPEGGGGGQGVSWDAAVNADASGRWTFAEAIVDLTAFGVEVGCPGFASAWIHTTSSAQYETASLKDRTATSNVDLSTCGQKRFTFRFDPAPVDGAKVYAVYTPHGGPERTIELSGPGAGGAYTAVDAEIAPGEMTFRFEVRTDPGGTGAYDTLAWRSDADPVAPGAQDGRETFTAGESRENVETLEYEVALSPATAENFAGREHLLEARVSDARSGVPIPGVPVRFATHSGTPAGCGSLSPAAGRTGPVGEASTTLTSPTACTTQIVAWVHSATGTAALDADEARGEAAKVFVEYRLTVDPDAIFDGSSTHTFTVLLTRDDGTGAVPYAGQTLVLDLSVFGSDAELVSVNGDPASGRTATCVTRADGTCEVTITSSSGGGSARLEATFTTSNDSGEGTFSSTGISRFLDARVSIAPATSRNEVGDAHTFLVTLQQPDESDWIAFPGQSLGLSLAVSAGDAAFVEISGAPAAGRTGACTTDADGRCTVRINAAVPGTATLTATFDAPPESGGVHREATASKIYEDFALTITPPSGTHEAGTPRSFLVRLTRDVGAGQAGYPGRALTLSLDPGTTGAEIVEAGGAPASGTSASCATAAPAGTCTVVVQGPGAGTARIGARFEEDLDGGTVVREASAVAQFVDYALSASPPQATREAGATHAITFLLRRDTGSGFAPHGGVRLTLALDPGESSAALVSANGVAQSGTAGSCTVAPDGTCRVLVRSATAGLASLTASFDTTLGSGPLHRSASASVRYVSALLVLTPPSATNQIETTHAATATLSVDDGAGGTAAGRPILVSIDPGPSQARLVSLGGVPASGTTGVCAGPSCAIEITAPRPGLVAIAARYEETFDATVVTRTAAAAVQFVDRRIAVAPPEATIVAGSSHPFTVSLQEDRGSGFAAAAGRTVALALDPGPSGATFTAINGAPASGASGSCVSRADGTCEVVVSAPRTGRASLDASATFTDDSGTWTFESSGAKRFVDYRIAIAAAHARAEVGRSVGLTVLLERDEGDGFAGLDDQAVALSLSRSGTSDATFASIGGAPASGTAGSCRTGASGGCTLAITASRPGAVSVSASFSTTLDSGPLTRSAAAPVVFENFTLSIAPPTGIREAGTAAQFTVTLRRDIGAGLAAYAGRRVELTAGGDGRIVAVNGAEPPSPAACTTSASGTCSVTLTADDAGRGTISAHWQEPVGPADAERDAVAEALFLAASVDKISCPGAGAPPGAIVTYTLSYRVDGAPLTGAMLSDALPPSFTFQSATAGGAHTGPAPGGTVRWNLGSVPDGTRGSVRVTGRIADSLPIGASVVNTVTLTAAEITPKTKVHTLRVGNDGALADGAAVGIRGQVAGLVLAETPAVVDGARTLLRVREEAADADSFQVFNRPLVDDVHAEDTSLSVAKDVHIRAGSHTIEADSLISSVRSYADDTTAGSSRAGSKVGGLVIDGVLIGDVSSTETFLLRDPLGAVTGEVRVLEHEGSGAAGGIPQPAGGFFASGLGVNGIHVALRDNPYTPLVDESTEIVVAHARTFARFPSGVGCGDDPGRWVRAEAFAADVSNSTAFGKSSWQQAGAVKIPVTGGRDDSTIGEHDFAPDGVSITGRASAEGALDPAAYGKADILLSDLWLFDGAIRSRGMEAHARTDAGGVHTADATLETLVIGGVDVCREYRVNGICKPPANTSIPMPNGTAIVVLNQQHFDGATLGVRAVHIYVTGEGNPFGLPAGSEITLASATTGVSPPG